MDGGGSKRRRRRGGRGGGGGRGRSRQTPCEVSSLLEVTLPDAFNSDLSDKEGFIGFTIEELQDVTVATSCENGRGGSGGENVGCGGNDGGDECLFPEESSDDETEFRGFTEQAA